MNSSVTERSARRIASIVALVVLIAFAVGTLRTRAAAPQAGLGSTWPMFNGDFAGTRFSSLAHIDAKSAGSMRHVCSYRLSPAGTLQSGPLVSEGVVFVTTQDDTVALDGTTCAVKWRSTYHPAQTEVWNTSHGAALADGKIYRGTQDAHLIALDAATGKQVWNVKVADPKRGSFLSAAPIVWKGDVYIGTAGADWGQKAHMMAFNAASGKKLWDFDLIPTGHEMGANSWGKASSATTGGGSTWTSYSLDTQNGTIFVPVGNPAPDFSGDYRPGANLFTDSLVALDATKGTLKWYYQFVSHDVHDYDVAAAPALVDTAGGKHLVIAGGKDCTVRALDRATGKLAYMTPVCRRENVAKAPTPAGVHVCPGWIGGVEWNGPAYDAANNTVIANSVDWCGHYKLAQARYTAGLFFLGGVFIPDAPSTARGNTVAFDADTGAVKWRNVAKSPMVAALTPTAGGVVFTGELGGSFLALDAATGKRLYDYNTKGAVAGGVVTYAGADGKQYVAVESGNESRTLWQTTGSPTLLIFSS